MVDLNRKKADKLLQELSLLNIEPIKETRMNNLKELFYESGFKTLHNDLLKR